MGHEYNEMIDVLSESINLTESIPMSREGLIEEFEPIFADDFSSMYNASYSYPLVNPAVLNLGVNRRRYVRNNNTPNETYNQRNTRRFNPLSQRSIVYCSRESSRTSNTPTQIHLSTSAATQSNNNIQIELSSDSGEETEILRQRNSDIRDRRKREPHFCNIKNANSHGVLSPPVIEEGEDSHNNLNSSSRDASTQHYSNIVYVKSI